MNRSIIFSILLSLSLISCSEKSEPLTVSKVLVQSDNIFIQYSDSSQKQLTFTNKDKSPTLLKSLNKVIFQRTSSNDESQFVLVDIGSTTEKTLGNSFKRAKEIVTSNDEKRVYFVDSISIKALDLISGTSFDLSNGHSFTLIDKAPFSHNLVCVGILSESNNYHLKISLIDSLGNTKKEFSDLENITQFAQSSFPESLEQIQSSIGKVSHKIDILDSMNSYVSEIDKAGIGVNRYIQQLNDAKRELASIEEFKLGRSQERKAQQLKDKNNHISLLEEKIEVEKQRMELMMKNYMGLKKEFGSL